MLYFISLIFVEIAIESWTNFNWNMSSIDMFAIYNYKYFSYEDRDSSKNVSSFDIYIFLGTYDLSASKLFDFI